MKKIISLILITVFLFSLVSCKNTDIPEGMKLASAENVPYKLFVPMAWVADTGDNLSMAYYSANDESNVQVTAYADGMSIEDYWKKCCEDYAKTFSSFKFNESDVVDTVLGGKTAKQYTYTVEIGGKEYKIMQTVTSRDSMIYSFTYTSYPDKFDSHLEEVKKMIEVFKFR